LKVLDGYAHAVDPGVAELAAVSDIVGCPGESTFVDRAGRAANFPCCRWVAGVSSDPFAAESRGSPR
jgi:hypothetical protein